MEHPFDKPVKRIRAIHLRKAGACKAQIRTFLELFPKGAAPRMETAEKHCLSFNWDWAVGSLIRDFDLRYEARKEIDAADKIAEEARQCRLDRFALGDGHIDAEAYSEQGRKDHEAWKLACARAFAKAFIAQQGRLSADPEYLVQG